MAEKGDLLKYLIVGAILVVLVGILLFIRWKTGFSVMTGYAVYEQGNQTEFNLGTYVNTVYNGSAIVLAGSNLTGSYMSKIFDAGNDAIWNNITKTQATPNIESLFNVDNSADIWKTSDLGATWNLIKDDYNNGDNNGVTDMAKNSSGSLFILFNQDVWVSNNKGVTWTKVNDDYNGAEGQNGYVLGIDNNNNLIIIEGDQDVWVSSNSGTSFTKISDDFNGGNGNIFGISVNSSNVIFVVDGQADVWKSTDSGATWTLVKDDYNGAAGNNANDMTIDPNNNLYILNLQDIWKSTDSGATWTKINDDFNGAGDTNNGIVIYADSSNYIYVIDGSEDVFQSIDSGSTFSLLISNFNGGNLNVFGLTSLIDSATLTLYARSCDDSACSGESWISVNDFLNLGVSNNRYFQYKVDFTSPDSSITSVLGSVSIDYSLVNSAPSVSISLPQNGTSYSVGETINLNFSASDNDNNLQACWYNLDNGNNVSLSNCANTTISANSIGIGSHIIIVYANDSLGLSSSASVNLSITNTAPIISIASPQQGATYGYNTSLALSYSVFDVDNNLQSCWRNLNNGTNISLPGCTNMTIDVSNGNNNLIIYANDSFGEQASDSVNFNVQVGAPTIILNSPIDSYLNNSAVIFSYNPIDIDLDYCELWGDFDGEFKLNQTDNSPDNGIDNTFNLNLSDGTYLWNIRCYDSVGNSAFNGNKTFYIDTTAPSVSLAQPTGAKTLRTVSASWSVSDINLNTCRYNVYRGASLEISNTSVNCSVNTINFDVTVDANFVFNFYVNDSAGNSNNASSSFSVDTSTPVSPPSGGSSGGGGGGGGSMTNATQLGKLSVSLIGDVIAREGDKKTLALNVKNIGKIFLNNCRLIAKGDISSWIYSTNIYGIAPGQNVDFVFDLNVPEETATEINMGSLEVKCEEASNIQNMSISMPKESGLIEIKDIKQEENILKINYAFDSSNFVGENIDIEIWLADENGTEIGRIVDRSPINKEGWIDKNVEMQLPPNLGGGVYSLYFAFSNDADSFVKKSVVLGVTGRAILDSEKGKFWVYILFLLILAVAIFFIWRRHGKEEPTKNKELLRKKGRIQRL